jgi:hypothetical protein
MDTKAASDASIFKSATDAFRFPPTAFPKGKPVQKNLDTHYVNLEGLFRSLAREGFGGTVLMVFEEGSEALIVFREGSIITAYLTGGSKMTGISALARALELARTNRAYVDVFKLEHEMLVALLTLFHGVQVDSASTGVEESLQKFRKAEFIGALVAGDQVPEAVCLIYAGIPMGWYDAQGGDIDTGVKPPAFRSRTLRAFALEGADTFAAINLELDKVKVAGRMREVLDRDLKEVGLVLYARQLAVMGIEEERKASKAQFMGLIEGIERAVGALRGPGHARRTAGDLTAVVETMIDTGF